MARFLDALRAAYATPGLVGGPGYIPAQARTGSTDPSVPPSTYNLGRGYAAGNSRKNSAYGLVRYAYEIGPASGPPNPAVASAGFVRMTQVYPMTSFDVCYRQIAADVVLEVNPDNGTTWTTIPATAVGEQTFRVTLTGRPTPDIRIRHKSGTNPAIVEGIMGYDGDETKGIHLWQAGLSSSRADQFTTVEWADALPRTDADLVVIGWLTNDAAAITSAVYKTSVQAIITNVRKKLPGVAILLAPPWKRGGALMEPWENYLNRLREIALVGTGIVFADMNSRQPSTAGLLVDGLHPTDVGHALLGGQYAKLLTT